MNRSALAIQTKKKAHAGGLRPVTGLLDFALGLQLQRIRETVLRSVEFRKFQDFAKPHARHARELLICFPKRAQSERTREFEYEAS